MFSKLVSVGSSKFPISMDDLSPSSAVPLPLFIFSFSFKVLLVGFRLVCSCYLFCLPHHSGLPLFLDPFAAL
jgi:hypothetical protein